MHDKTTHKLVNGLTQDSIGFMYTKLQHEKGAIETETNPSVACKMALDLIAELIGYLEGKVMSVPVDAQ